ncbi:Rrf2 family transcriptional regulator [Balneolaceae bacterium YR4-1]|uniref:Rrf2 family transcriptional regulator n=1 Tax=Halalkalibaculum roseum TaxID=2709311 RepID=A0A6M1T2V4_9BACT|nr:Rrf2 family transcriptional regulator [Halalkalibaculum roseum]NGP77844.1 Rrf2 family transcriptional regulator [Halalkalibaculum roseum]
MFSASCHYGLQAMFYIALHSSDEKNVDLNRIAEEKKIPKHFLSKILQMLVKDKLLVSMKGPTGGYKLSRPADEITLLEIVDAIDGLDIFDQCGIGFRKCNPDKPCPIHNDYKRIRDRVYRLFEDKTLVSLNEEIKSGNSMSKIVEPSD